MGGADVFSGNTDSDLSTVRRRGNGGGSSFDE